MPSPRRRAGSPKKSPTRKAKPHRPTEFIGRRCGGGWQIQSVLDAQANTRAAMEQKRRVAERVASVLRDEEPKDPGHEGLGDVDDPFAVDLQAVNREKQRQVSVQLVGFSDADVAQSVRRSTASPRGSTATSVSGGVDTDRLGMDVSMFAGAAKDITGVDAAWLHRGEQQQRSGKTVGRSRKVVSKMLSDSEAKFLRIEHIKKELGLPKEWAPQTTAIKKQLCDNISRMLYGRGHIITPAARANFEEIGVDMTSLGLSGDAPEMSLLSSTARNTKLGDIVFQSVEAPPFDAEMHEHLYKVGLYISASTTVREDLLKILKLRETETVAITLFWFVYCAFYQKRSLPQFVSQEFATLSKSITLLKWKSRRATALDVVYIAVTHAVCLALKASFPGSRQHMTINFYDRCCVLTLLVLTGVEHTMNHVQQVRQTFLTHRSLKLIDPHGVPLPKLIESAEESETSTDVAQPQGADTSLVGTDHEPTTPLAASPLIAESLKNSKGSMRFLTLRHTGARMHDPDFHIFNSNVLDVDNARAVMRQRNEVPHDVANARSSPEDRSVQRSDAGASAELTKHLRGNFMVENSPSNGAPSVFPSLNKAEVILGRPTLTPAPVVVANELERQCAELGVTSAHEYYAILDNEVVQHGLISPRCDPYAVEVARNFALDANVHLDTDELEDARVAVKKMMERPSVFDSKCLHEGLPIALAATEAQHPLRSTLGRSSVKLKSMVASRRATIANGLPDASLIRVGDILMDSTHSMPSSVHRTEHTSLSTPPPGVVGEDPAVEPAPSPTANTNAATVSGLARAMVEATRSSEDPRYHLPPRPSSSVLESSTVAEGQRKNAIAMLRASRGLEETMVRKGAPNTSYFLKSKTPDSFGRAATPANNRSRSRLESRVTDVSQGTSSGTGSRPASRQVHTPLLQRRANVVPVKTRSDTPRMDPVQRAVTEDVFGQTLETVVAEDNQKRMVETSKGTVVQRIDLSAMSPLVQASVAKPQALKCRQQWLTTTAGYVPQRAMIDEARKVVEEGEAKQQSFAKLEQSEAQRFAKDMQRHKIDAAHTKASFQEIMASQLKMSEFANEVASSGPTMTIDLRAHPEYFAGTMMGEAAQSTALDMKKCFRRAEKTCAVTRSRKMRSSKIL